MEYTKQVTKKMVNVEPEAALSTKPEAEAKTKTESGAEEKFEYRIVVNDHVAFVQDFKPGVEGWQLMTAQEAEEYAQQTVVSLKGSEEAV